MDVFDRSGWVLLYLNFRLFNFNKMSFREESIQLVAVDSNKMFYLTKEAKHFLFHFEQPISIVSIAGMYRTGKSYLINKLLNNKEKGFKTGSTVQAVTKGLNIWGSPIITKDKSSKEICYLVIDSQGIGSCEEQVKYDLKIMMLIFIISSTVLYNSMGAIDQLSLDQLRVVTNLKKIFAAQQEREKIKLVWVLRDFALQLIDKNGIDITPNEYLEQCLEETPTNNSQMKKKNEIRRSLKQSLRQKCCYTLVRPTMNEDDLQDLTKCKLRNQFVSEIELIRQQIFRGNSEDIKLIEGSQMTGKLLVRLLEQCILKLNEDGIPEVGVFWQTIKSLNNEEQYEKLMSQFKQSTNRISLPMDKEILTKKLKQLYNESYDRLYDQFKEYEVIKTYNKQFIEFATKIMKDIEVNNAQLQKLKVLRELREFVKQNIDFGNIEPSELTVFRPIIERIQLKVGKEEEGYKYIISTMLEVMALSEQRSKYIEEELRQIKQIYEKEYIQKRNMDGNILQLKKDYHEALKAINQSKLIQQSIDKENMQLKHQKECINITLKNYQQELSIKENSYLTQIQQIHAKNTKKHEELNTLLSKLRQQNNEQSLQLQTIRQQKIKEVLEDRKQFIFEEKINEAWNKFSEEREMLKNEIQRLKQELEGSNGKAESLKGIREKQEKQQQKERNNFKIKERQYVEQLKQLKRMHADTKKTYSQTYNALKDNDKMNKNLENIFSNNKSLAYKKYNNQFDQQKVKKHENEIERVKEEYQRKIKLMNDDLINSKQMLKKQKGRFQEQKLLYENERQERLNVQNEVMLANDRFVEMSKQVQIAKQRERALYEQSIVRLLSNLDKKEMKSQEYSQSHYAYKR